MKINPIKNKVMLKRNDLETVSESGLIVSTPKYTYFDSWIVEAVGSDIVDVKVGDIVYVDLSTIKTLADSVLTKVGEDKFLFVTIDQIVAVQEE